jgi:hypothetical protein
MEANLYVFISVVSIYFFTNSSSPRPYLAIFLASVAYTFRLEAGLLMAILCLYELFTGKVWVAIKMGFIGSGFVAGVGLLTFLIYGTWVPQSVIAKEEIANYPAAEVLKEIFLNAPLVTALLPVVFIGLLFTWKRSKTIQIFACWALLYTLAYAVSGPLIFPWYSMPIYFSVIFIAAYVLSNLAVYLRQKSKESPLIYPYNGLIVLPVLSWIAFYFIFGVSPVIHHVYAPLKSWCSEEQNHGREYLAWDIGALGYYCEGYIHDMAGLISPQYTPYKDFDKVLENSAPQFIFSNTTVGQARQMESIGELYNYQPIKFFAKEGVSQLGEIRYVGGAWVQSYVMYELQEKNKP